MSIPDILYTLLIGPLETVFEMIYMAAMDLIANPGLSIIGLSLVMNLLLLPLYKQTDAIQMEAIETEKRMKPYVTHIKKTFKGNEQFMMLQTCYRQNHYKPTDALKGISPLALEIPFFMAAYNYLSGLNLLQGAALGPITDLGQPDGLLVIGGLAINVLPILMTLINVLSSLIYTKDAPLKTKIQLYGMAALFLVLLYDSPAGLAFYWTLNNLFSLVKNALMKTKKPMLVLGIPSTALSVGVLAYTILQYDPRDWTPLRVVAMIVVAVVLNVPLVLYFLSKRKTVREKKIVTLTKKDKLSFFSACLVLTLLVGVMIPASLIHTSPEEFIIMGSDSSPVLYVLHTGLLCAGLFLVWFGLFYALAKPAGKKIMEYAMWAICGMAVLNYMCFGKHYGTLSNQLVFDMPMKISAAEKLVNLGAMALVAGAIYLIWSKKPDLLRMVGLAAALAIAGMSTVNLVQSQKQIAVKMQQIETPAAQEEVKPLFRLSKTGKNVVVLMMDRAVNGYLPFILNEKPELQQQFAGFTYYPHTISFGAHTNIGLPAVFGGYEYMPAELNKRNQETMGSKHDEAMKVLPVLFDGEGFETTVCDPTYAGYDWIPDLSIYRDYPDIDTYITMGQYNHAVQDAPEDSRAVMERKFLYYSIFRVSPVMTHLYLYDGGWYQAADTPEGQSDNSNLVADGQNKAFIKSYGVLKSLPGMTQITDDPQNTFMMMCNDTAHSPQLLQLPDYVPQMSVDNSDYDKARPERTSTGGETIVLKHPYQTKHYHCNMASYLQIGRWLDYLRENDVYDNTRIIIVSDHGYNVHMRKNMEFGDAWMEDVAFYNPILMIKDFGSTEFTTDETFMTNADVPTLATAGVIDNPVNPFTGNPINNQAKDGPLYVFTSHQYQTSKNNGTTFLPDPWIQIQGDMMLGENWHYVDAPAG